MQSDQQSRDGLLIGLMTGTSMDAMDAALVRHTGLGGMELEAAIAMPLPDRLRARIADAGPDSPLCEAMTLDAELAALYAEAVDRLLEEAGFERQSVVAIGCHGQTVWHAPERTPPISVQLGDPNMLAERTGITVVADFRRRDMAAGGEGAPLAPAFHHAFFSTPDEYRVVANIGGMTNITLLPDDSVDNVSGFDTGPGNVLMDSWIHRQRGERFDRGGLWAASGVVHGQLLDALLGEPYFARTPPKSTGRELFNDNWLNTRLQAFSGIAAADVQATLCELTAVTLTTAIRDYAPDCARLLLCGGGAHNTHLHGRIAALLPGVTVTSTSSHGMDADWVEAAGFAWLARETLAGRSGNIPAVTGAKRKVVLGGIYTGRPA